MNIYLTFEREAKLRSHAKSVEKSVGVIVSEFIDNIDHKFIPVKENIVETSPDLMPMCGKNFCKSRSIGKYKIITNDGEEETILDLCTFHWNQARKEGEVINVET